MKQVRVTLIHRVTGIPISVLQIYPNVDQTHLKKKCVWFQTEKQKKSQNYILFVYMQKFLVRTFYKLTVSFD